MTKYPELFNALAEEFAREEVKKLTKKSKDFWYVTARTIQNRLDAVLGPENWWDNYTPNGENSVFCHLTVRLPDGSLLTKTDVGGGAGMADAGDDDKSAVSDALKRAAARFGVGRYLYGDGVPYFAAPEPLQVKAQVIEPVRALPAPAAPRPRWLPRTGQDLIDWIKDQQENFEVRIEKEIASWTRRSGYPPRMVEWSEHQAVIGFEEAERLIKAAVDARSAAVTS